MADNQSTIALNIGSQKISMAVFEPSKSGGLVLKGFDSESILADPSTESSRVLQIRQAVGELVGRMKVKGKVRYAISGQSAFIRFVKLPPLDDDNVEQLVTFEAQQHVPFPLDEVVWDYEILEAAGEKEVVIVAIKGDALEDINDGVNDAGLSTAEVDVAPMALYNSFRAAYPQITEPVLLIDVGAKTSDLLYIEGNRFFTRSAQVGGSAITTAISKEFDVPFAEAEVHKTQNGLVALGGGHTEQLDEPTAALAMSIRNAMTRLATEIPRTTNYYRSQHNGSAPKQVFLAGGGVNLPYAKEFFAEKLKLPVEYFNPLPAISIGKGVDAELLSKEAHTMGELIGLGLRGIGKSKLNIDLVPSKVGEARAAQKRKPFLLAAAAVLLIGLGIWGFMQMQAANQAEQQVEEADRQREILAGPANSIRASQSREDKLREIASGYVEAEAIRTFWLDSLEELKASFASDKLWFVDLTPLAGYVPGGELKPGLPVVNNDFLGVAYGQSMLDRAATEVPEAPRGGGARRTAEPAGPTINAIRLRGFWRANPRGQNLVYDKLKDLQDNAAGGRSHFKFTVTSGREEVPVEQRFLAPRVDAAPGPEEFASAFELILPLSREIPLR